LQGKQATTTFIQSLPFSKRYYRVYLPLMPLAIEQLDLSGYDLIFSVSHAVAKGVIIAPGQHHISICCSPMRYLWDLRHQYLKGCGPISIFKNIYVRYLSHKLRVWDAISSDRVDQFIAISHFTKERIHKHYRREAAVIYPPVSVEKLPFSETKEEFYLTASRLVYYKRVDLIVETFRGLDKKLIVIGTGPEYRRLIKMKSKNIIFLGHQPDAIVHDIMKRARAFIFAAEEDFGIAPVEAMACGTAVIAYGRGGATESVRGWEDENSTGLFFEEQTVLSLRNAILFFEKHGKKITPAACRKRAEQFSTARFCEQIRELYESLNFSWR
jgi:glycosyltransferase involved in cell wall biosynthesis